MSKNFKNYLNVYEFEYTLPGSQEVIKFKPLITSQMKQLLQYEDETDPVKVSEALDKLIESSVITEGFNIDDLYLRDRFALLIEIRKKTKGENYEFQFVCPNEDCKSQIYNCIDLDKLETKTKEVDTGTIKITDDLEIEIGHLTRRDEKEAIANIENIESLSDSEKEYEHWVNVIASSIKSVTDPEGKDDDITFEDKKFVIENTPQSVLEDIGNWFLDNWFGVNFTYEIYCKNCGFKKTESIPMNQLFS